MDIKNTYFHTMSISRNQDLVDESGITTQKFAPVDGLQSIACAFSRSNRSQMNTTQTESVNSIVNNPKIFCNPELDIQAGDRITIMYKGRNLGTFSASYPYPYDSHQEVVLLKESEA